MRIPQFAFIANWDVKVFSLLCVRVCLRACVCVCVCVWQSVKPGKPVAPIGCYIEWKTDVNLGPPFPDQAVPDEDKYIVEYYNALQYALFEIGYPLTQDSTCHGPRTDISKDQLAITIFGSACDCLGILLEGEF
jgi:hypothetical protein